MYCVYCGTKIDDDSVFCHNCGKATGVTAEAESCISEEPTPEKTEEVPFEDSLRESVEELFEKPAPTPKKKYFGWKLFGFFLPFVALFMWFAWQSCDDEEKREKAEAMGIGLLAIAAMLVGSAIPIIPGVVLFFVLRKDHPEIAVAILVGTLLSILVWLIGSVAAIVYNFAYWVAIFEEFSSIMALSTLLIL